MEKYCKMQEGKLIIYVPKELDHHEAGSVKQEADFMIDAYHVKSVVFDFSGTEFMDSSGIGMIIGSVTARNLNERIRKIFRVSGLHTLIQMDET